MTVCEDAPCCGCCGHTVWAAEAQSEAEWAMEAHYDDGFGPEPYDDGDEEGRFECLSCDDVWVSPGEVCPECGEVVEGC